MWIQTRTAPSDCIIVALKNDRTYNNEFYKIIETKIIKILKFHHEFILNSKFFFETDNVNFSFVAIITDLKEVLKIHRKTFTMEYLFSKVANNSWRHRQCFPVNFENFARIDFCETPVSCCFLLCIVPYFTQCLLQVAF